MQKSWSGNIRAGRGKLIECFVFQQYYEDRNKEMSVDTAEQVIAGVRASNFGSAIQLNGSTDVNNCCQLLFYVCFTQNDVVKTELLLSHEPQLGGKRSL